jgi:hypothetical protein
VEIFSPPQNPVGYVEQKLTIGGEPQFEIKDRAGNIMAYIKLQYPTATLMHRIFMVSWIFM